MSSTNTTWRDAAICRIIWLACFALVISIAFVSGWKTMVAALFPLLFFTDLVIWLGFSIVRLPCGFTEWVCYPFWTWPFCGNGFHMRVGVIVRIIEIVTILISGHWLWETVKSLF